MYWFVAMLLWTVVSHLLYMSITPNVAEEATRAEWCICGGGWGSNATINHSPTLSIEMGVAFKRTVFLPVYMAEQSIWSTLFADAA